jgi:hypothetical protein
VGPNVTIEVGPDQSSEINGALAKAAKYNLPFFGVIRVQDEARIASLSLAMYEARSVNENLNGMRVLLHYSSPF